jgi:hypothetical protein
VVGDVLVVAPLEAVWLTGSELQLQDGRGCLSFEVKGESAQRELRFVSVQPSTSLSLNRPLPCAPQETPMPLAPPWAAPSWSGAICTAYELAHKLLSGPAAEVAAS